MGSIKVKASKINAHNLPKALEKITGQMYVKRGDEGDSPAYGDTSLSDNETYIDFKEPLNWSAVLGDYKYNPNGGFDALDCLFYHLKKMISSDKYVFSREFLKDRSSCDNTINNKLETLSEIIDMLNSYSSGNEHYSDIMEFLYKPLYEIREDYVFVKHSLSLDYVDIPDDTLERVKPLFGFYRLDVLPAGDGGSLKRKLVYNPPENESGELYLKIKIWGDALLCFPVDENHNNLSIDLSVLEGYLDDDQINSLVKRSLIKIVNGNDSEKKARLTPYGATFRRSIFNRQKDKISGLLVPRDFLRPESPIIIGELIDSDRIK